MTETAKDNIFIWGVCTLIVVLFGAMIVTLSGSTRSPELPQSVRVGETPSSYVNRWRDDEMKVTCWQANRGFSCLRDAK